MTLHPDIVHLLHKARCDALYREAEANRLARAAQAGQSDREMSAHSPLQARRAGLRWPFRRGAALASVGVTQTNIASRSRQ